MPTWKRVLRGFLVFFLTFVIGASVAKETAYIFKPASDQIAFVLGILGGLIGAGIAFCLIEIVVRFK